MHHVATLPFKDWCDACGAWRVVWVRVKIVRAWPVEKNQQQRALVHSKPQPQAQNFARNSQYTREISKTGTTSKCFDTSLAFGDHHVNIMHSVEYVTDRYDCLRCKTYKLLLYRHNVNFLLDYCKWHCWVGLNPMGSRDWSKNGNIIIRSSDILPGGVEPGMDRFTSVFSKEAFSLLRSGEP